jgi:ssDNA-binding Zn-finger/Zn-ribbon topoisomerase 1
MVLRVAKLGKNVGNKFWGCSHYPYCKAIVNITNKESIVEKIKEVEHFFRIMGI